MKKMILLLGFVFCIACSNSSGIADLKELADNYTLEQAKNDQCLVMENGDVTYGEEIFSEFLSATINKEDTAIRIVNYYTLGDKSQYSEEAYQQEKEKYPQLYITDVVFENGIYTTYSYDNNDEQLLTKTYKYMIKDEFAANPEAAYTTAVYYILVNDNNVKWNDILKGMVSSQADAWIDHFNVYQKHKYK